VDRGGTVKVRLYRAAIVLMHNAGSTRRESQDSCFCAVTISPSPADTSQVNSSALIRCAIAG